MATTATQAAVRRRPRRGTAADGPVPAGEPSRQPARRLRLPRLRVTVRARILTAVLLFTTLGMAGSGTAFLLFEQRQETGHLDDELASDVTEFRLRFGRVPPGTPVGVLLNEALTRPAPTDEALFGLVNGHLRYAPDVRQPFDLEHEPALLAEVAALPATAPARIRQSRTSVGDVRWVAVQVTAGGSGDRGTYVVAVVLAPSQERLDASIRQYVELSALALVLAGTCGWLVTGRLLQPLRQLGGATRRISSNDLTSRVPVTGDDDVSELTRSVNAMLDRLQAAFDAQQEFLDDAGHELRTPLTVVRGHLELLDARDPADVEAVRVLVMDELDRMARLVGDLILLAQARRPDFVRFEPVDLDHLLHAVTGKASALADRHWVVDSSVGAVVLADEQRLTQAMLQLADNAARHTRHGDLIAVGGAVVGHRVLLWVRDSGPGVAPQDVDTIFERFGRGRPGRGHDGSGLGLSIVSGIAVAHGGRVVLAPSGSPGACFTLDLPLEALGRTVPAAAAVPAAGVAASAGSGR